MKYYDVKIKVYVLAGHKQHVKGGRKEGSTKKFPRRSVYNDSFIRLTHNHNRLVNILALKLKMNSCKRKQ